MRDDARFRELVVLDLSLPPSDVRPPYCISLKRLQIKIRFTCVRSTRASAREPLLEGGRPNAILCTLSRCTVEKAGRSDFNTAVINNRRPVKKQMSENQDRLTWNVSELRQTFTTTIAPQRHETSRASETRSLLISSQSESWR